MMHPRPHKKEGIGGPPVRARAEGAGRVGMENMA